MFSKEITYTDYDGKVRTEKCYFHLSKPELMQLKRAPLQEIQDMMDKIHNMENPDEELSLAEQDKLIEMMGNFTYDLVVRAYGEKSDDGRRFIKVKDGHKLGQEFTETEAYSELYMEIITDPSKFTAFVRGIIPPEYQTELDNNLPELREDNLVQIGE